MSAMTFRNALADLVVTGVERRFDQLPNIDAEIADLPAQWPRAVTSDHATKTYTGLFFAAERRAELVIVVRPGVMANYEENTNDLLTLSDNLEAALDGQPLSGFKILEYSISFDEVTVSGTSYVAVVADIAVQE